LLFHFPTTNNAAGGYITPFVKLEFGSLTDQKPTGTHLVRPLVSEALRLDFEDCQTDVIALELERTFWEKATILHAEHHRPEEKVLPDRFSRHYSDFAALWNHSLGPTAKKQLDLLERVIRHKNRFFSSGWARYETARPGTFRLCPPAFRVKELTQDYAKMRTMFLREPPIFEEVLKILSEAEVELNAK
jgi:hypothetical protein